MINVNNLWIAQILSIIRSFSNLNFVILSITVTVAPYCCSTDAFFFIQMLLPTIWHFFVLLSTVGTMFQLIDRTYVPESILDWIQNQPKLYLWLWLKIFVGIIHFPKCRASYNNCLLQYTNNWFQNCSSQFVPQIFISLLIKYTITVHSLGRDCTLMAVTLRIINGIFCVKLSLHGTFTLFLLEE